MCKATDTIIIDYDEETMFILRDIVNRALENVYNSGIPIDFK